jgi:CTP synthase (UTP-ammonia lyase)
VLGIRDAEHEETAPGAQTLLISKLACSLVAKNQRIRIAPGSHAHRAYNRQEVIEQFFCNYGLNSEFQDKISTGNLRITGIDLEREVRIVELSDHPFYVATLFLPQVSSTPESPHPLIVAYLTAGLAVKARRNSGSKRTSVFA